MSNQHGTNLTNIKEKNRTLALQLIATGQSVSRADLARIMHLSKTTLGNIVSELIAKDIICKSDDTEEESSFSPGRKPIALNLSPTSPLIAGMLIKRNLLSVVLANLKGTILKQLDYEYETMDGDLLVNKLMELYNQLCAGLNRRILAVGISSIGPVDTIRQVIIKPANFWGIHNFDIADIISRRTGLPAYLIHDCSAGALAEKIYGVKAEHSDNMLYLHIMNGIGVGYILQGQVYDGDLGQGGELGHMSINFAGPKCSCGNAGCLEMYANTENMNLKIQSLRNSCKFPPQLSPGKFPYSWSEIITSAETGDFPAQAALDDFCNYLVCALRNTINLLDIHHIIVGHNAPLNTTILEDMLTAKLNTPSDSSEMSHILIERSSFGGNAPLIGSIAVVTSKIFNGELNIF